MITIDSKVQKTYPVFIRLSEANVHWAKGQAREHGYSLAGYIEQLITALKGGTDMAKAAKKPAKKSVKKGNKK